MDEATVGALVKGPTHAGELEGWLREHGAQRDAVGYLYSGLVEAYALRQWPNVHGMLVFERYRLLQPSCASVCLARHGELVDWLSKLDPELPPSRPARGDAAPHRGLCARSARRATAIEPHAHGAVGA